MNAVNNGCEGSQNYAEQRYLTLAPAGVDRWFALLSMNRVRWVNCYIIPFFKASAVYIRVYLKDKELMTLPKTRPLFLVIIFFKISVRYS